MEDKKISDEELDKLRSLNQSYKDLKFQIADIEVTFSRLKSQKISTIAI